MLQKICTVIGARPQFIKASPLSIQLRKFFKEVFIHTGQHYNYEMSDIFFEELCLPKPDYILNIRSGSHGSQTGQMLISIETVLKEEKPDFVLLYGDTNTTLAGALAASKLHIPIIHVEAGLRSFNKLMPEEINRVLTDHISDYLFTPSEISKNNLEAEGISKNVFITGDIMYDAILLYRKTAEERSEILEKLNLNSGCYYTATIHRAVNTDNKENLQNIISALTHLEKVILPIHPRTRKKINEYNIVLPENLIIIEPLGYLDMIRIISQSICILTDSGGIQKEAYYLEVPCITLREETEWIETVNNGWNFVAGTTPEKIIESLEKAKGCSEALHPPLYGDGHSAELIVNILQNSYKAEACAA